MSTINEIFKKYNQTDIVNNQENFYGWVRTTRTASNSLGFCNINDGSNVSGLQIILSTENYLNENDIDLFFKNIKIGCYLKCQGYLVNSPANGQSFELQLQSYQLLGAVQDGYPLCKSRMNLETLRIYSHLRSRTNIYGSIFRIRSKLSKIIHDFFQDRNFLNLDPNIITINECEGGAGVFQITEHDISKQTNLKYDSNTKDYDWGSDHFGRPAYLTVSSQLQLEALACSLGNVYTMNKSFRSEHSCTTKHLSEFTHLEIEIINNNLDDLMNIAEEMIKYSIEQIFKTCESDIDNLDNFISKGIKDKLNHILTAEFIKIKYCNAIQIINQDIKNKKLKLSLLTVGDDLGSEYENYLTEKYNSPVFVTHWPSEIKSFYMKQLEDGTCESFDLLMPYGIGELVGASQREDDYDTLIEIMKKKNINLIDMEFYLDLRKYGSCPHGGFGLGFDRLLMFLTGIKNIRDVIPFPVYYKGCKY